MTALTDMGWDHIPASVDEGEGAELSPGPWTHGSTGARAEAGSEPGEAWGWGRATPRGQARLPCRGPAPSMAALRSPGLCVCEIPPPTP